MPGRACTEEVAQLEGGAELPRMRGRLPAQDKGTRGGRVLSGRPEDLVRYSKYRPFHEKNTGQLTSPRRIA